MIGTPLSYTVPNSPEWTKDHTLVGTFDSETWDKMVPFLDSVFDDESVKKESRIEEKGINTQLFVPKDFACDFISGKLHAVESLVTKGLLKERK